MITVHNNQNTNKPAAPFTSSIVWGGIDANTPKNAGIKDGYEAYSRKSTITMTDPASINENETKSIAKLANSRMDLFNRARAVDIAVNVGGNDLTSIVAKTGATELLCNSPFGNWRNKNKNNLWEISQRIFLNCTSSIQPSYKVDYSVKTLSEVVLKEGVGKKISSMAETTNEIAALAKAGLGGKDNPISRQVDGLTPRLGERMSMYSKFPVAQIADTSCASTFDNLEFTFSFGQAGMYSGEEEVVKPILALANIFCLQGTNSASGVVGALPSVTHAKRMALQSTITAMTKGGSELASIFDSDSSSFAGKALDSLNNAVDALYATMDAVALDVLKETVTVVVVIGGLVTGPYVVKTVTWSFDFDEVDEFGFPCSGKISLGGLTPVKLNIGPDFARQWGYSVGTGKPSDSRLLAAIKEASQNKDEVISVINS